MKRGVEKEKHTNNNTYECYKKQGMFYVLMHARKTK